MALGWDDAALGLISLFGGLFGGGNNGSTGVSSQTTDPNIQAILDSMKRRTNYQDPLYQAITNMAMGLLPKQYQVGMNSWGSTRVDGGFPSGGGSNGGPSDNSGGSTPYVPNEYGKGGRYEDPTMNRGDSEMSVLGNYGIGAQPTTPWSSPDKIRKMPGRF